MTVDSLSAADRFIGCCLALVVSLYLQPEVLAQKSPAEKPSPQLTLSQPPSSEVAVAYATSDDTAIGGLDYVPAVGVVRFPAGVTNRALDVLLFADGLDEPDESFFLTLSGPTHASLLVTQAQCLILDADPPCLSISDTNVIDDGSRRSWPFPPSVSRPLPASPSPSVSPRSAPPPSREATTSPAAVCWSSRPASLAARGSAVSTN